MIITVNMDSINKNLTSLVDICYNYDYNLKNIEERKEYILHNYDNDEFYIEYIKKLNMFYSNIVVFKNNIINYCDYVKNYLKSYEKTNSKYETLLSNSALLK